MSIYLVKTEFKSTKPVPRELSVIRGRVSEDHCGEFPSLQ